MTTTTSTTNTLWICEYDNGIYEEARKTFSDAQTAFEFAKFAAQDANNEASVFNEPMDYTTPEWLIIIQADGSMEFIGSKAQMDEDLSISDDIKRC